MNSRVVQACASNIRKFGAQPLKAELNKELVKGSLKQTNLPNDLLVVSLDNLSPISRFGAFIRAGSRFEPFSQLGLTHTLRYAAGMSTQKSTIFGITRNIEYLGGSLTASTTRDDFFYQLNCLRDYGSSVLKYLGDTVTKPAFKSWQMEDYQYRLKIEVQRALHNPQVLLMEALHRVAFRGGLSNPLYCPEYMLGKHETDSLMAYVNRHFVGQRMALVGLNVDHDQFVQEVEKHFHLTSEKGSEIPKSKFIGGETRIPLKTDTTMTAVVTEGAS